MGTLREAFVERWHGDAGTDRLEELDEALHDAYTRAVSTWPDLAIPPETFARYLGERADRGIPPPKTLRTLRVEELFLACGCTLGLPAALDGFDRSCLAGVDSFLDHVSGAGAVRDEVRQLVRNKLLVAEDGEPGRIAQYQGRGPLAAWVGIVAQRTALSLLRSDRARARAHGEAMAEALTIGGDPELDYLRVRYRDDFRAAFAEAIAELPERDRLVLRLHLVDALTHEEIARMYGVSQSTVTRWIAHAREAIGDETHRRVCARLQVDTGEFESLAALVESQLDLSLTRLLRGNG